MEEDKAAFVGNSNSEEETISSEMEVETVLPSEKGEGSNGNVVFLREPPLVHKDFRSSSLAGGCSCGVNKIKSGLANSDSKLGKSDKSGPKRKLSRQDRIELGRLFQGAVSDHDWELAESLILLADPQTLNDALCIGWIQSGS